MSGLACIGTATSDCPGGQTRCSQGKCFSVEAAFGNSHGHHHEYHYDGHVKNGRDDRAYMRCHHSVLTLIFECFRSIVAYPLSTLKQVD